MSEHGEEGVRKACRHLDVVLIHLPHEGFGHEDRLIRVRVRVGVEFGHKERLCVHRRVDDSSDLLLIQRHHHVLWG